MSPPVAWQVSGSYFEACNCDAICPCRTVNGKPGGRSTHGVCQFALSWLITDGCADEIRLDGRSTVLAGWCDDDAPDGRWSVVLYVDDGANDEQWCIQAARYVSVAASTVVNDADTTVSCGIPGDDHPGQEVVSDELRVDDHPLQWDLTARCGFATGFAYSS